MKNYFKIAILFFTIIGFTSCKAQGKERQERKERPSIEELFKDLDSNEDGKLSKKEVKGPLERDFDKIDINEDGFLSKEEIVKMPKPERKGPPKRN